jgi:hypothetical protein
MRLDELAELHSRVSELRLVKQPSMEQECGVGWLPIPSSIQVVRITVTVLPRRLVSSSDGVKSHSDVSEIGICFFGSTVVGGIT